MKFSDAPGRATTPRPVGEIWDDERFREARDQDLQQRTTSIRSAVAAAITCLVFAALLTSGRILDIAQLQEFGPVRDRQVAAAEGLDRVANFSFAEPSL